MYLKRDIEPLVLSYANQYPIVIITGPRQSGKTTLSKALFNKPYVSLEDLDNREFASTDPRGFLNSYHKTGAIFDEVQRTPSLINYIQTLSDELRIPGHFILTGSQQFDMMANITQSLAGRAAFIELYLLTLSEAYTTTPTDIDTALYTGLYPRIFDTSLDPTSHYAFYTKTYLERDVRQLINVRDITTFTRFLKLCAGRTGQLLNLSALGNECDVSYNTIKHWLSLLEASYIIKLLQPYHGNITKRLTKTPKLYFLDSGLASYLMGIRAAEHIAIHPLRGALFETYVVTEFLKHIANTGAFITPHFYRDSQGNEIGLVIENESGHHLIEIKSSETSSKQLFNGFTHFPLKTPTTQTLVYGGSHTREQYDTELISWTNIANCKLI